MDGWVDGWMNGTWKSEWRRRWIVKCSLYISSKILILIILLFHLVSFFLHTLQHKDILHYVESGKWVKTMRWVMITSTIKRNFHHINLVEIMLDGMKGIIWNFSIIIISDKLFLVINWWKITTCAHLAKRSETYLERYDTRWMELSTSLYHCYMWWLGMVS